MTFKALDAGDAEANRTILGAGGYPRGHRAFLIHLHRDHVEELEATLFIYKEARNDEI